MAPQPREKVEVTYPGYEARTLNIIIENLRKAKSGNVQMQASIAIQFFKTHNLDHVPGWDWKHFRFSHTSEAGRPPKRSKSAKVETYGCTCERDCAACDQGWHKNCRYGCMHGQPVTR